MYKRFIFFARHILPSIQLIILQNSLNLSYKKVWIIYFDKNTINIMKKNLNLLYVYILFYIQIIEQNRNAAYFYSEININDIISKYIMYLLFFCQHHLI